MPLVIAAFGFSIFAIAVATAKDLQTVMIGRFFGGFFGSCPLAVVAAAFADMFNNKVRGLAVAVFAATVFMGPLMAPFVSLQSFHNSSARPPPAFVHMLHQRIDQSPKYFFLSMSFRYAALIQY